MSKPDFFLSPSVTEDRVSIRFSGQVYGARLRLQREMETPADSYSYSLFLDGTTFKIVADTPLELKTRRDNFLKSYRAGYDVPFVAGTIRTINANLLRVDYF